MPYHLLKHVLGVQCGCLCLILAPILSVLCVELAQVFTGTLNCRHSTMLSSLTAANRLYTNDKVSVVFSWYGSAPQRLYSLSLPVERHVALLGSVKSTSHML